MKKILLRVLTLLIVVVIVGLAWLGYDLFQNSKIVKTAAKDDYSKSLNNPIHDIMISLEEGKQTDYSQINESLEFINQRYDTSDFRMPSIIRILYNHEDKLPDEVASEIKASVLNFKYWMDQPGDDSMCYWSENHQILFASAEYLLGHYYKDEIFTNMNILGQTHSHMGKKRLETWLNQRFLYGFTEWNSSTYYVEDMASLAVLIDFSPDEEIRLKATMS